MRLGRSRLSYWSRWCDLADGGWRRVWISSIQIIVVLIAPICAVSEQHDHHQPNIAAETDETSRSILPEDQGNQSPEY